jgi:hypothetical protein
LKDDEIRDFFTKIFNGIGIGINEDAMKLMIRFSSGFPNMMHEIGDGIFWRNNDNIIDYNDTLEGIIRAGQEIGWKYLQPALDKSIRSESYLSIFRTLGEHFPSHELSEEYIFRKKDIEDILDPKEKKAFSDFLKRARDLNIIEYAEGYKQGVYTFTNNLYPIYFLIQYLEHESYNNTND